VGTTLPQIVLTRLVTKHKQIQQKLMKANKKAKTMNGNLTIL